jgi:hypothetical protein
LRSSKKQTSARASRAEAGLTSLGVPLQKTSSGGYLLDLSDLRLFTGLSVLAGMIGEEILEQARRGGDIATQHRIVPEITPELASLGIHAVHVLARKDVLKGLASFRKEFHTQIRAVFGTLQRPAWGGILFPEFFGGKLQKNQKQPGLLFPYHLHFQQADIDYFFLVERDTEGHFLRITIETEGEGRLDLKRISHAAVSDLHRRTYLQGLTRMAESIQTGIRRECENFQNEHVEDRPRQPGFFDQISQAGLAQCEGITVHWPVESEEMLLNLAPEETVIFLRKILIVLEDTEIVRRLHEHDIEVVSGNRRAFLDLSRRGRSLNISLDRPRSFPDIRRFLAKMPALEALSGKRADSLKGVRILLIHHITGEILATIRALENMKCEFLRVLFVKYAGIVPPEYLETLLSLSDERFAFHGLNKIEAGGSVEGYYVLSRQYSPLDGLRALDEQLHKNKMAFFEAMQLSAGNLFFREAAIARKEGKRLLLIEDGGYLAPQLNTLCLEKKTLRDALNHYGLNPKDDPDFKQFTDADLRSPLAKWLADFFAGSVEHTRNGYDRLCGVQNRFKKLQFPAASIAISKTKRETESREVSVSILHAVESILHGQGLVLSNRRTVVLGSRGAIGRCLVEHLKGRIGQRKVAGIDIAVTRVNQNEAGIVEVADWKKLPADYLLDTDVFVGVIGKSILTEDILESLILRSKRPALFFASGSTKTLEFTHLSQYVQKLRGQKNPRIKGKPVRVESEPVRDPQTGLIQGSLVRINMGRTQRKLYLLGGLTPINFLYYGVPTETMDPVLTQLVRVAAGLLSAQRSSRPLPPRVLAVDHEISVDAELLK